VSDSVAEKDEASSNQALSEENKARLKEVFFWLQKDAEDHVWFEDRWMVASLCDE
jgi:hypothetical protein